VAREGAPDAGGEPLLKRLLRRRADPPGADTGADSRVEAADAGTSDDAVRPLDDARPDGPADDAGAPRIDPRSGKPIDALVDADLPPLESIGPDSDVSAFLGRNISPALRRAALRRLFAQPKFNVVCLCAEYAEDYRNFTALGSVVPHDMARQLAVQAERAARRALESGTAATTAPEPVQSAPVDDAGDVLQRSTQASSTKVLPTSDEPSPASGQEPADKS
jgi:hypothetical protein